MCTEFVNTNVLEVFPRDVRDLFYADEAFSEQVIHVDIKTQHAQPFLHAHLHNPTIRTYILSLSHMLQSAVLLPPQ